MASTYLSKAGGTATNRRKFTISFWVKRGLLNTSMYFYETYNSGNPADDRFVLAVNSANKFRVVNFNSGSADCEIVTNRALRDVNAWYHIVVAIDTTQSTASNRIKIYINGVEETSFSTNNTFAENAYPESQSSSYPTNIGRYNGSAAYFDGSLSHFNFIDGTQYQASAFGETDATTGEWVGKTSPSVTYGNNGFFILKDGNSLTDQSGEGNDFTLGGGTLTDLKDNPDNTFATLNPLNANIGAYDPTLSMGNNRTSNSTINKMQTQYSTIAPSTGKFYCEVKATAGSVFRIGISSYNSNQAQGSSDTQNRPGQFSEGWGYDKTGNVYKAESSVGSYTAYNTGDIICIALDMTNKKLYFRRDNNAWENSANPATGSNGIDISSIPSGTGMAFGAGLESGSVGAAYADFNFGNGFFGTTAITTNSGNGYAGAEGASKFNYTVPAGYSALSTKGLNE